MEKYKFSLIILSYLIFCVSLGFAFVVSGTVYDENLNEIKAVITIEKDNKIYGQIVTDGKFEAILSEGNYTFYVWNKEKNLSNKYEGVIIDRDLSIDFVLIERSHIPEIVSVESFEEGPEIHYEEGVISITSILIVIIIVALLIIFYFIKRKISELSELREKIEKEIEEAKKRLERREGVAKKYLSDEEMIYQIIQEEGEVPQKKIVEKTGFSKAKVTLILKKLEKMGKIKRFVSGREKIVRVRE